MGGKNTIALKICKIAKFKPVRDLSYSHVNWKPDLLGMLTYLVSWDAPITASSFWLKGTINDLVWWRWSTQGLIVLDVGDQLNWKINYSVHQKWEGRGLVRESCTTCWPPGPANGPLFHHKKQSAAAGMANLDTCQPQSFQGATLILRSPFLRLVGREPILREDFLWFSSFEGGKKWGRGEKCGWEEESVGRENHQIFSHQLTLPPLFPPSNEVNHRLSSHKIGSHQFFSHKWGKGVLGTINTDKHFSGLNTS